MSQPSPASVSPSWEDRKTRATKLRSQQPHAEQLLTFYLHLLELQEPVYRLALTSDWLSRVRAPSDSQYPLLRLERLPVTQMVSSFQRFLRDVSARRYTGSSSFTSTWARWRTPALRGA